MSFEFDNNNFATAGADEGMDTGTFNVPTKISSVTTVTDKDAEKAAKKAAAAQKRAEAKAAKQAAAKEERERIRSATYQRVSPVLKAGTELAELHDEYVKKYVTSANADLYSLLSKIHAFAEEALASADLDSIIKEMRENLRWEHEIKTQANSPALNIIVRYVTRTNRKNACVYARVISKAMADGITSAELAGYIVENDGINNIRTKVEQSSKVQEKIKLQRTDGAFARYAMHQLHQKKLTPNVLGKFKCTEALSSALADGQRETKFVHMYGTRINGEIVVVDFSYGMTAEMEQALLAKYTLFELENVRSSLEESKAVELLHKKIQHVFDAYNAFFESKNDRRRLNRFGETENADVQMTEFSLPQNELDKVYAVQQATKARHKQ